MHGKNHMPCEGPPSTYTGGLGDFAPGGDPVSTGGLGAGAGTPKNLNIHQAGKPGDLDSLNAEVQCEHGYRGSQDPDRALGEFAGISKAKESSSLGAGTSTRGAEIEIPDEGYKDSANIRATGG